MVDYGNIVKRADGSYIINNGMFHVPNDGDFAALWADIEAYAKDTPTMVSVEPGIPLGLPTLAKRAEIKAGFMTAMSASLTMPSVMAQPSAFEVAAALFDWRTEDPEGYASLLAIHTARRDELLAAVEAAGTAEDVQAIVVSYAV